MHVANVLILAWLLWKKWLLRKENVTVSVWTMKTWNANPAAKMNAMLLWLRWLLIWKK